VETGRPARVLHVLSGGTVGGCEQHVLALLARLDRDRYEPWLACFEAEPDEAAPAEPRPPRPVGDETVEAHETGERQRPPAPRRQSRGDQEPGAEARQSSDSPLPTHASR
jgi:hypothetical protein